ncbi:hypothetical protein N7540_011271 [Penicillium herquei]|nr:hypothetical protein N7540_011271 [Penicillium herquei]
MTSSGEIPFCKQLFPRSEVASHNKEEDLWVIIDGKVFNLTSFLDTHPGGRRVLLQAAGSDATKKFHKYHRPETLIRHGDAFCIGSVGKADSQGKRVWRKVMSTLFHSNDER